MQAIIIIIKLIVSFSAGGVIEWLCYMGKGNHEPNYILFSQKK